MPGKDVITINRVILMGRLTKNPEIKYAGKDNDMAVARYTLAVNRRYKRDGEDLQERIDEMNGVVSVSKKEIFEKREQLKKLENLQKMAGVIKTNQPLIDEYNHFFFSKKREKYYQQHKKKKKFQSGN